MVLSDGVRNHVLRLLGLLIYIVAECSMLDFEYRTKDLKSSKKGKSQQCISRYPGGRDSGFSFSISITGYAPQPCNSVPALMEYRHRRVMVQPRPEL